MKWRMLRTRDFWSILHLKAVKFQLSGNIENIVTLLYPFVRDTLYILAIVVQVDIQSIFYFWPTIWYISTYVRMFCSTCTCSVWAFEQPANQPENYNTLK